MFWCSKCDRPWPKRGYCTDCMRDYMRNYVGTVFVLKRCESCDAVFTTIRSRQKRFCDKDCAGGWYRPRKLQSCGTDGAYQRGCRCDQCRAAHAQRQRTRLAERRIAERNRQLAIKTTIAEKFTAEEIFKRDGWRCHICRKSVRREPRFNWDPLSASLDHIVPLSKGGAHIRENVACAHLKCNQAKRASMGAGVQPLLVG
jgi:5-methylcytosine-specific restriction endonuclease McrA